MIALTSMAVLIALVACGTTSTDQSSAEGPERTAPTTRVPSVSPAPEPDSSSATVPSTAAPPSGVGGEVPDGEDVTITRIVDGDTLVVRGDERVRLIGIDSPELNEDECFADQATDHLTALVRPGTPVRLVYDVERYDRYGRTLAYLYRLDDGLHVNLAMAADGFAQQLTVPPNVAHAPDVNAAVAEARDTGRGLWGAGCDPATPGTPDVGRSGSSSASGECDPSYPTLCIPPGIPDLDCADITDRYFPVLPPDPHRFDGNNDGVGCEMP